jgi:anti-anti-sigma factor
MALPSEIDVSDVPELERYLAEFAAPSDVVLDWAGVDFCCVAGIATVIRAAERHRAHGGSLTVANARPVIVRVVELLGASELLEPAPLRRVDH